MNNFEGQLHLYPEVCIDNFSSDCIFNIHIRCYILTHFHDDHMKNLEDYNFYKLLKDGQDSIKFLCSPVTKKFIQTCPKYEHLGDLCYEVECESPVLINVTKKECLTVTFCGSGHCPGSVMVFLEGSRGNVLFTGDFRLPLNSAKRLSFFKEKSTATMATKQVKDLYIDMTFFKPEIQYIPSREESVESLNKFLKQFLNSNNYNQDGYFKNVVYLKTSARIGYEYVLQKINESTGYKIHVNELIYQIYEKLPAIQMFLTLDSRQTPIHACIYENRKRDLAKTDLMSLPYAERKSYLTKLNTDSLPIYPCELINDNRKNTNNNVKINAVKIILSAMWFTDTAGVDNIFIEYKPPIKELNSDAYKYYKSIYRLCFSFHSSFAEIIDFVNFIKPIRLHSIALPESTTEKIINDYFYNSNGKFNNFQLNNNKNKDCKSSGGGANNYEKQCSINNLKSLNLRKRKSFREEFDLNFNKDSSSDDATVSDDNNSLNFGSDLDEDNTNKKIKNF